MGASESRSLRGLPSLVNPATTPPRRPGRDELTVEAARLAGQLAARATVDGGVVSPAPHGDVAIELRQLFPLLEDPDFDQSMGLLDRAARFISSAETADADDSAAYAEAAWEAGLDAADFGPDGSHELRQRVIDHWDLALLRTVQELVVAHESTLRPADAVSTSVGDSRIA